MRMTAFLAAMAVLSVVLMSGCTQGPPAGPSDGGTGGTYGAAEDQAATALEEELSQAAEGISDEDLENALLEQ